jgi:hypothetical protein
MIYYDFSMIQQKQIKKKKTKPPSKTTRGGYLTDFESSGGRITGLIVRGLSSPP